jgi:hypothetical protein
MKTEQQMRKAIMRRVYGVYLMRQLGRPITRVTAFFAICLAITSSVSMPNVIANALHSSDFASFVFTALANTKSAVQLGILLAGLLVVWTFVDIFRTDTKEAHASI